MKYLSFINRTKWNLQMITVRDFSISIANVLKVLVLSHRYTAFSYTPAVGDRYFHMPHITVWSLLFFILNIHWYQYQVWSVNMYIYRYILSVQHTLIQNESLWIHTQLHDDAIDKCICHRNNPKDAIGLGMALHTAEYPSFHYVFHITNFHHASLYVSLQPSHTWN